MSLFSFHVCDPHCTYHNVTCTPNCGYILVSLFHLPKMRLLLTALCSDTGRMGGVLKGIVTSRDVDFLEDDSLSRPLSDVR